MTISERCERLREAYESRGVRVSGNLRPGLTIAQLQTQTMPLGFALPAEIRELYAWHDGVVSEEADDLFLFRDNCFLSLERSLEERANLLTYHDFDPHVDLRRCLPIASFEGSTYVLACGAPPPHPVVLVFQGVEVHFRSLAIMLDTCRDWVLHPGWDRHNLLPPGLEREIWLRHNPGIF